MKPELEGVSGERVLHIYRTMVRVRAFDEKLIELGKRREPIIHHPTLGQEAPAVAACAALNSDDVIMPYHRGWAWAIGKGMEPGRVLAELLGKRTGYCKGQAGPHLADWDLGVLGRSGIQGAHLQIAAGVGCALKLEGKRRVCLAFFGEGPASTGAFHEGVHLAALWQVPVVYICESNNYQFAVPAREVMRVESVAEMAPSYRIPGVTIDGNDALQIFTTVGEAIRRARDGLGPTLIDCRTYRWHDSYYQPENMATDHRPAEEVAGWRKKCPILRLKARMIEANLLSPAQAELIEREAEAEIESAVKFAYESPYPRREELTEDVYAS
ncbi:MAG TPA: thiamine pyrophosphate-dependent dehydrogenase E1 component subunit alpha [Candidatus Acidoferrales bacterium]|nr:thiamine pyrophosphate-dependent dehydrogenase E1 component subunit alpha [Candidatus Acidoferrales bacterium]